MRLMSITAALIGTVAGLIGAATMSIPMMLAATLLVIGSIVILSFEPHGGSMNNVLLVVNHFDTTTVYNIHVDNSTLNRLQSQDKEWFTQYEAQIPQSCILHSTSLNVKSTGTVIHKAILIVVDL